MSRIERHVKKSRVHRSRLGALSAEWRWMRSPKGCLRTSNRREDLRLRFGYPLAFDDEFTLRRVFGLKAGGEMIWSLDENGAVAGIAHSVMTSPREAEIALIVRSDLKGFGIGEFLLRTVMARAARQGLKTLIASILRDNRPMLRLAMKVGCVMRHAYAETVEIAFNLSNVKA
jgi:RimJ/RimL family protein N-acetyltransferase